MPKNSKIVSKQLHQKLLIAYGKLEDVDKMVDELVERGSGDILREDMHLRRLFNDIRLLATSILERIEHPQTQES